jgi:CRP-like cAMP-binding protein
MVATQVSLANDDARKRIAQLLLSLISAIGKAGPEGIELPVRNEDLATGADVTPFTASRVLGEWQRAGVLTKRRGSLVMRKPELLLAS